MVQHIPENTIWCQLITAVTNTRSLKFKDTALLVNLSSKMSDFTNSNQI